MSTENIKKFTEDDFQHGVQKGVTLVDFYADWCGPCRTLAPVLEKVAKEVSGQAIIAKLDIDHAQKIASDYKVTSIPTLILFKDGKEIGRIVGLRDQAAIKDFILSSKSTV